MDVLSGPTPRSDNFLKFYRTNIEQIAQELLKLVKYSPCPLYRGIILKHKVDKILPHQKLQFLSFSTDRSVAENFADINGFGSTIMDISSRLGTFGYVIDYLPKLHEVLFHHDFLSLLPYEHAYTLLGMKGKTQVEFLKSQKEVVIFQPAEPFTNFTTMF